MNEKTIWFGRYLGCQFAVRMDTDCAWQTRRLSPKNLDNLEASIDCGFEYKLILKELKDMSDEDLKNINGIDAEIKVSKISDYSFVTDDCNLNMMPIDRLESIIDAVRDLGYAIGIPKEYYITKSELKP